MHWLLPNIWHHRSNFFALLYRSKSLKLPTVGQSPSPSNSLAVVAPPAAAAAAAGSLPLEKKKASSLRESSIPNASSGFRSEVESELDFLGDNEDEDDDEEGGVNDKLCDRLDLPHGVAGVESCRSAMSSDLEFDRGDSCGSFEFLSGGTRGRPRRPSVLQAS